MNEKEIVKQLEDLFDKLGIDTSCEIHLKVENHKNPSLEIRGAKHSIMAGLTLIMVKCMDAIHGSDIKENLNCLNIVYMNAKKEIIKRGEENEKTETTDMFNEENSCEE